MGTIYASERETRKGEGTARVGLIWISESSVSRLVRSEDAAFGEGGEDEEDQKGQKDRDEEPEHAGGCPPTPGLDVL